MGREATNLSSGSLKSETQTSFFRYRDKLEILNFACCKPRFDTLQGANNKGADQSVRMPRLVCAFVVRKPPKTGFLMSRPIYIQGYICQIKIVFLPRRSFLVLANSVDPDEMSHYAAFHLGPLCLPKYAFRSH